MKPTRTTVECILVTTDDLLSWPHSRSNSRAWSHRKCRWVKFSGRFSNYHLITLIRSLAGDTFHSCAEARGWFSYWRLSVGKKGNACYQAPRRNTSSWQPKDCNVRFRRGLQSELALKGLGEEWSRRLHRRTSCQSRRDCYMCSCRDSAKRTPGNAARAF
jgi:hypothetical protein